MINPTTYEGYAEPLVTAAIAATFGIGRSLKGVVSRLVRAPGYVSQGERAFMDVVEREAARYEIAWQDWTIDELANAYLRGVRHTEAELNVIREHINIRQPDQPIRNGTSLLSRPPSNIPPTPQNIIEKFGSRQNHLTFYEVFRAAATDSLRDSRLQIIRTSRDIYRNVAIMAGEASFTEADTMTRRQLSQRMLNDFADKGIQSIVYRDGRRVSLEAYSEMVGRSMSGRAAVQASLNRFQEYGYDLVRISSHFRACDICQPWEGRVLSQSGDSDRYPSLDEAIADGLFHVNCAHDANAYFPGISPQLETHVDPGERALVNEHGYSRAQQIAYEAQEKQRQIERNIRKWKRRETVALVRDTQHEAHRKVLEWQAAQRQHLEQNPFLIRKYQREAA